MPILRVEIISAAGEKKNINLATIIADKAGDIFDSKPGGTWVSVKRVMAEDYAENGGGPPNDVRPVFVEILLAQIPDQDEMQRQVILLTDTIAEVCDRPPENVHIQYLPAARGRMAFGGRFVT